MRRAAARSRRRREDLGDSTKGGDGPVNDRRTMSSPLIRSKLSYPASLAGRDFGERECRYEMSCVDRSSFHLSLFLASLALAQQDAYRPPLGDIMNAIQLRHIKLWFAGKLGNWELATYEVGEIKASLEKAADLYRGIPAELVTNTADPILAIGDAIEFKTARNSPRRLAISPPRAMAAIAGLAGASSSYRCRSPLPLPTSSFSPHPAP